jgi:hypothetical protein
MERTTLQKIAFCTMTAGVLVASQSVLAHTRLQTPTVVEGTRVYNNAAIGHGCNGNAVVANSIVFPDGTDSTIKINDAVVPGATVDQFIDWGGKIAHVASKDVFENSAVEFGRAGIDGGNAVGNHSWGGNLPGTSNVGLVPIRINGAFINPESCALSVTFQVAIADICEITGMSGFSDTTVNFWTPALEGSNFNGDPANEHHYNSPATYKITRDLKAHPLPNSCKKVGVDVVVDPSADQLNHDLPIPGVWPLED